MSAIDVAHLSTWIGKTETVTDQITPELVRRFEATIAEDAPMSDAPGAEAPIAIHWCLGVSVAPMRAIGPDGHAARGEFLPPVPLPRRMWAGGRIRFEDPLRVGDAVTRLSKITSVKAKQGRSGVLCFVTVEHTVSTARGTALVEEHDIVYREAESGAASPAAPEKAPAASFSRSVAQSPVLLFRYSALTFNGHRIHYDQPYATGVEHYPGLVFHGPLQATLMLRLAAEALPGKRVTHIDYRGIRPLFDDGRPMTVNGAEDTPGAGRVWCADADGNVTMKGTVAWA